MLSRSTTAECNNWKQCKDALVRTKEALHGYVKDTLTPTALEFLKYGHTIACFTGGSFGASHMKYNQKSKSWEMVGYDYCQSCKDIAAKLQDLHTNPSSEFIGWSNLVGHIHPNDYWSIAKVYMPLGNERNTGPTDTDLAELLHVVKTCKLFKQQPSDIQNIIDAWNTINLPSADKALSTDDRNRFLGYMLKLLEDESSGLKSRPECQEAAEHIRMLEEDHTIHEAVQMGPEELAKNACERLESPESMNWLKSTKGLVTTKKALHVYIEDTFSAFVTGHPCPNTHNLLTVLRSVQYDKSNRKFNIENIESSTCSYCSGIVNAIVKLDEDKQSNILWSNLKQSSYMNDSDHWAVAKLFLKKINATSSGPNELDPAAVFRILHTCALFGSLDRLDRKNLLEVRNALMHSKDNTLSTEQMDDFFKKKLAVLENEKSGLKNRQECQKACKELEELQQSDLVMVNRQEYFQMYTDALEVQQTELANEIATNEENGIDTTELKQIKEDVGILTLTVQKAYGTSLNTTIDNKPKQERKQQTYSTTQKPIAKIRKQKLEKRKDRNVFTGRLVPIKGVWRELTSSNCRNWSKCMQGLVTTKKALHGYIEENFSSFVRDNACDKHKHLKILQNGTHNITSRKALENIKKKCSECSDCKNIVDEIVKLERVYTNRPKPIDNICWSNNGPDSLSKDHWMVAKMFLRSNNANSSGPSDLDPGAVFRILHNCNLFKSLERHVTEDLIHMRRALVHSTDNTLKDPKDVDVFFEQMIALLEHESSGLKGRPECQKACRELKKLHHINFTITKRRDADAYCKFLHDTIEVKERELKYEIAINEEDKIDTEELKANLQKSKEETSKLAAQQRYIQHGIKRRQSTSRNEYQRIKRVTFSPGQRRIYNARLHIKNYKMKKRGKEGYEHFKDTDSSEDDKEVIYSRM